LITNLNGILPTVQAAIDREYYYCYGDGKIQVETTGNTLVYVVRGEAFGQYIETAYGQGVNAPTIRSSSDFKLQVVDPFSRIWTSKFGFPSVTKGSQGGSSGDFSCLGGIPSGSSNGRGVISAINSDGF
jgi:hypothetical protein